MSVSFCLLVTGSPTQSQAHLSALEFVAATVKRGYKIHSVFFYQEAVAVANRFVLKPDDEAQLGKRWLTLSHSYQFELQICVAAGNRRGVLSQEEAANLDDSAITQIASILPQFQVVGLGQLAATLNEPRVRLVQFK